MKPLLVPLLLVSLAGNAVLAFFVLRPAAANTPVAAKSAATAAASPSTAPAVARPAAPDSATWQNLKPGANLHDMVANLRAAGFPPAVIRAIASQMASERIDRSAMEHLPFWKQNFNNPEYAAAQQQAGVQQREMINELLGADARLSATLEPAARERRFGTLSDEKIDQIDTITRDFNDMRTKLYANRKPGDVAGMIGTQNAMEEELHKELATVLNPVELEQYEMRSSQAASRVMSNVKGIDVTETEYAALFRAQKAFDAVNPTLVGNVSADTMALRNTAQAALNEQARAVLTDDRYYEYLKGADASYARTAQFTANYPAITPAATYELMQLERDYQTSMLALSRGVTGVPNAERVAQFTAGRKDYQDKLNNLLGPEAATAFLNRNRPGTATVTTTRTSP